MEITDLKNWPEKGVPSGTPVQQRQIIAVNKAIDLCAAALKPYEVLGEDSVVKELLEWDEVILKCAKDCENHKCSSGMWILLRTIGEKLSSRFLVPKDVVVREELEQSTLEEALTPILKSHFVTRDKPKDCFALACFLANFLCARFGTSLKVEVECRCVYDSDCHGIEMIKAPSGKEWAIGGTHSIDRWKFCPWCGGILNNPAYARTGEKGK